MITAEQIPPKVVAAAADALLSMPDGFPQDADPDEYARAAIAAGLAAWPGMQRRFHIEQALILPLPKEARDD